MDKEIIRQAGLSDNEAEVYLLLLQLGEGLASEIAEKSKISRPHIYDTIAKLIDKGLASYVIKNNRKYFRPANPEALSDLLKSKQMSLQKILPDLKKLYTPSKEKPVVEVYEGKDGLKVVLNELLRYGKDFSALGPTTKWKEEAPIAVEQYFKQREKIGFRGKLLCPEGTKVLEHPLNDFKFLPKQYSSPATTVMYGNKTCFVLWLDTIISIFIENKELADSFKSYFDMMWNTKTKTYTGKEAAKVFLNDILDTKPKEYLISGGKGNMWEFMPEFKEEYIGKRKAAGIKIRRIYNDTLESRKAARNYKDFPLREHKFIPLVNESPLISIVYGDRTWICSWNAKNPLMILIEDKSIADGFTAQFNQMWNQKHWTYNGIEGLKNILNQMLDESSDEILTYGTSGASIKLFPEFIKEWHKKRIKKKITLKIIYTDSKDSRARVAKYRKDAYVKAKYMPGGYESPVGTMIYGNKVTLVAITKDGFATVIENDEITKIYKKQFETLWKISKDK